MARMVRCVKLGQTLPGLDRPPFPGELGKRIYENVSKQAWAMWLPEATLIMNHYGLVMADPAAQDIMLREMEKFFFGEGTHKPEDWTPEG